MNPPAGDDERTTIGQTARPALGHTLPPGTRLLDYEIAGLVGEGGFGIVYLAWDHSLQRQVAIKEYMPASMAARAAGASAIVVKSDRHVDTFKAGLKSFVNEARLLARFDHPSLLKVYRFWEENGTAYMAMPFYQGPTLKAALAELGRAPSEAEVLAWLRPLLDALSVLHAAHCFHRDIAPDNILLTPSGPLLLDFGAARRVIGDMTHALTVVLKPGYAPIEQYGEVATMTQGAWTDLYALASVVYFAITGTTPTTSVERLMDDRLGKLQTQLAGRYSAGFLRAIDAALALRPHDRPQTEAQFRALLDEGRVDDGTKVDSRFGMLASTRAATPRFPTTEQSTVPGSRLPAPELPTQWLPRATAEPNDPATRPGAAPRSLAPSVPAPIGRAPVPSDPRLAPTAVKPQRAPVAIPVAPSASRNGLLIVAGVAALMLGGAAAWLLAPAPDAPAAATAPPAAAAVAPPPTAPIEAAPAPSGLPMPRPVTTSIPGPGPNPPPPPTRTETAIEATPLRPRPPPTPSRVDRPSLARPTPPAATEAAPSRRAADARCSDILQKASLEPLTADEAAYLRRECR